MPPTPLSNNHLPTTRPDRLKTNWHVLLITLLLCILPNLYYTISGFSNQSLSSDINPQLPITFRDNITTLEKLEIVRAMVFSGNVTVSPKTPSVLNNQSKFKIQQARASSMLLWATQLSRRKWIAKEKEQKRLGVLWRKPPKSSNSSSRKYVS